MKTRISSIFLTSVLILAGCGRSDKSTSTESVAADPVGVKVLSLSADDTMKYSATLFEATSGESLRLILTNKGHMPKQAMAHNWVLLQPMSDADVNAFAMAAATSAPDYIPASKANLIIVHTKLLGPGESDQIDFKAPSTPGEYPFLCSFPGHFVMMKGKLIVK